MHWRCKFSPQPLTTRQVDAKWPGWSARCIFHLAPSLCDESTRTTPLPRRSKKHMNLLCPLPIPIIHPLGFARLLSCSCRPRAPVLADVSNHGGVVAGVHRRCRPSSDRASSSSTRRLSSRLWCVLLPSLLCSSLLLWFDRVSSAAPADHPLWIALRVFTVDFCVYTASGAAKLVIEVVVDFRLGFRM